MMELFAIPSDLIEEAKESVQRNSVIAISKEDRLLETVLASGNIEVLERYIALRKSEEERQARIVFEEHFAQLRADLRPVVKQKENTFLKSKYAPLEVLQDACDAMIAKHGFFYTWREEAIEGGKRIWMDISGYGHTRSNYFDTPDLEVLRSNEGKAVTNILQARGIQSTYGQRYTFKAGFGIVIAGEDTDGERLDEGSLEMDLRTFLHSGKLSPEATKIILDELAKPDKDITKLRNYWKRAKAKVEK
jgi:hypothetical protein